MRPSSFIALGAAAIQPMAAVWSGLKRFGTQLDRVAPMTQGSQYAEPRIESNGYRPNHLSLTA